MIQRIFGGLLCYLFIITPLHATPQIEHYLTINRTHSHALTQFFQKMPKGGELHYHLAGGAQPEKLIELVSQGNYCLDVSNYVLTKPPCQGTVSTHLIKDESLYEETLRAWSMHHFTPTHETGHDHFFGTFFKTIPGEADFRAQLLASVIERAALQHELYMEIMVLLDNAHSTTFGRTLTSLPSWEAKRKALLANPAFNAVIQNTIKVSHQLLPAAHKPLKCESKTSEACSLTVKWQYFVLREQPLNEFFAQALHGFIAASKAPEIVGINVVQAEDGPIALRDYKQQMQIFKFLHHHYPKIHIALHAGELAPHVGHVQKHDLQFHIQSAMTDGFAERIGHGIDILYETNAPILLHKMAHTPTPVEINLTSNQKILNVSGLNHPLRTYLKHHVPIVLSTDDEGILRTNLTQQYVIATKYHYLSYAQLKQINRNSLTYSFLPGKSLWQEPKQAVPVRACSVLQSQTCDAYVNQSPKAKLQRQLELNLTQFEAQYK